MLCLSVFAALLCNVGAVPSAAQPGPPPEMRQAEPDEPEYAGAPNDAAPGDLPGTPAGDVDTLPDYVRAVRHFNRRLRPQEADTVARAVMAAAARNGLDGRLLVVRGDPVTVIPRLARDLDAASVHISADYAPYGSRRDRAVEDALGDVPLVRTGSPYAVSPGRILKGDGSPYRVFTPFRKAWLEHGWRAPARTGASTVAWIDPDGVDGRTSIPADDDSLGVALPPAGEAAARKR